MTEQGKKKIAYLQEEIASAAGEINRPINIMEVCGTHTVALRQTGVLSLIPPSVRLVSGPGCPVCVTPSSYIENALNLIEKENVLIASFGDMLKVPAPSGRSLSAFMGTEHLKIIYSPMELLELAESTEKSVVFLGVGFETTIPTIAVPFLRAASLGIKNLYLYPAFKLVSPALTALMEDPDFTIDGFLLPGHVSVVIGVRAYDFLCSRYNTPGVVTGFEGEDILAGIEALLKTIVGGTCLVKNVYTRVVRKEGNGKAREVIQTLLEPEEALWRGFGAIPESGMKLRPPFRRFDAEERFGLPKLVNTDPPGCLCGKIVQGKACPTDCSLFGKVCTPERPTGPCMVSSEGTCAAYFKFGGEGL